MATLSFSQNILSQVDVTVTTTEGKTLAEALSFVFAQTPRLKSYLLNDDGSARKHVAFIVNGEPIRDRKQLSDSISEDDDIFVMQALSGG